MARIRITNKMSAKQAEKTIKRIEEEQKRVALINKAKSKKEQLDRIKK